MTHGLMFGRIRGKMRAFLLSLVCWLALLAQSAFGAASVFTLANSGATLSGGWTVTASVGGHNARQAHGRNPEIEGKFTGTQLEYFGFIVAATDFSISVDGGAFSTVTATTTSAWAYNVMVTGLTDTQHTFRLQILAGAINDYIDVDTSFRITGASPAMTSDAAYAPVYGFTETAFSPYFAIEGSPSLGTSPLDVYWNINRSSCAIRFRATTSTIKVWYYLLGGSLHLSIDGVDQSILTMANTGVGGYFTVGTGLDGAAQHEYTITSDAGNCIPWGISLAGGILNTTTLEVARGAVGFYGNSITFGQGATDNRTSYVYLSGKNGNFGVANRGVSGTTVKHFSLATDGETRFADITGLSPAVTSIFILYGTNDMSQAGGAETPAQFLTSYTNMLNSLLAGSAAGIKIYAAFILQRTDISDATRALWNASITSAAAACNTPSRITVLDTTGWINTATDLADTTHPNDLGHAKIAAKVNALFLIPATGRPDLGLGGLTPGGGLGAKGLSNCNLFEDDDLDFAVGF